MNLLEAEVRPFTRNGSRRCSCILRSNWFEGFYKVSMVISRLCRYGTAPDLWKVTLQYKKE